jgi:hypothetical protein
VTTISSSVTLGAVSPPLPLSGGVDDADTLRLKT